MKSKKAQLQAAGSTVDFYAYIIYAVIIIIFILIFSLQSCSTTQSRKASITESKAQLDSNLVLINYLRTPIQIDLNKMDPDKPIILQKMTMVELISSNHSDYKSIQEKTEKIFKDYKSEIPFQVLLNLDNGKCIFECGTIQPAACAARTGLSEMSIPLANGNSVNLGFCYWSGKQTTKEYGCRKRIGC